MGANAVMEKIPNLGDLELAALLCLIAEENCIVTAEPDEVEDLAQELRLVSSKVFGLSTATVDCSEDLTMDDFAESILHEESSNSLTERNPSEGGDPKLSAFLEGLQRESFSGHSPGRSNTLDERKVADVVIAKHLNFASSHVQIQALELIRGKRIFSRTAVHTAPKRFLFVALLSADGGASPLMKHLNDLFAISHYHSPDGELAYLEAQQSHAFEETASVSSVLRTPSAHAIPNDANPIFSAEDISALQTLAADVKMGAEVRAYTHNIICFLRLHRCVAGGISALATRHFHALLKVLSPLHELSYVTPSLVGLAVRKVYPHRIVLATPYNERSLQWGSDRDAVAGLLEGVTVEDVIEDVLKTVDVPA